MEKQGFTLVELLVVITVLAVLATGVMLFINPAKRFKQSQDARIKSDINQLAHVLLDYYTLKYHYPTAAEGGLNALVSNEDVRTIPTPPGGGSYFYSASNGCDTYPYTGCEAILYFPLKDPSTQGNVWCWRSRLGTVSEVGAGACTL